MPEEAEGGTATATEEGQSLDQALDMEVEEATKSGREILDEAFEGMTGEETTVPTDRTEVVPGEPVDGPVEEEPTEEPEATGAEEASATQRYRDPESGEFINAQEAKARGLEPEELVTEEEAASEFFGDEETEEGEEAERETLELELSEEERLEIEVDDPETRAALEEKLSKAERVERLESERAELEGLRADVQEAEEARQQFEEELQTDPVGFITGNLPGDRKAQVAVDLLFDDDVHQAVIEKLDEWSRQPHKREVQAAKREKERLEEERTRKEVREAQRAVQQTVSQIVDRLNAYVPEDMSPQLVDSFLRDAGRDLQEHIERNEMYPSDFDLESIPEVIGHRFDLYGIDPSKVSENGRPEGSNIKRAEPRGDDAKRIAKQAEDYRKTGERLRKARARKKSVASSAPPGAGAGPSRTSFGADATLDEALEEMDKRVSA